MGSGFFLFINHNGPVEFFSFITIKGLFTLLQITHKGADILSTYTVCLLVDLVLYLDTY